MSRLNYVLVWLTNKKNMITRSNLKACYYNQHIDHEQNCFLCAIPLRQLARIE